MTAGPMGLRVISFRAYARALDSFRESRLLSQLPEGVLPGNCGRSNVGLPEYKLGTRRNGDLPGLSPRDSIRGGIFGSRMIAASELLYSGISSSRSCKTSLNGSCEVAIVSGH